MVIFGNFYFLPGSSYLSLNAHILNNTFTYTFDIQRRIMVDNELYYFLSLILIEGDLLWMSTKSVEVQTCGPNGYGLFGFESKEFCIGLWQLGNGTHPLSLKYHVVSYLGSLSFSNWCREQRRNNQLGVKKDEETIATLQRSGNHFRKLL